jgi:hypothetical protein
MFCFTAIHNSIVLYCCHVMVCYSSLNLPLLFVVVVDTIFFEITLQILPQLQLQLQLINSDYLHRHRHRHRHHCRSNRLDSTRLSSLFIELTWRHLSFSLLRMTFFSWSRTESNKSHPIPSHQIKATHVSTVPQLFFSSFDGRNNK